jgi:uncharacterized protein
MDPAAAPAPLLSWRAWARLLVGLAGFGVGIALMVRSGLGLGPWDAFHAGISRLTGISIGSASIGVGVVVVAASTRVGVRPGAGTLANMVLVGLFIDLFLRAVPAAAGPAVGLAMYALAIVICGLATGLYISAGLGKGPRDGVILALAARSGRSIRTVRTLVEFTVLALGWAMGGRIGPGTLLFALAIGPAMQWGLRVSGVPPARAPRASEP